MLALIKVSISLDLGYGLISLVDSDLSQDLPGSEEKKSTGPLISKITGIRKQVSKELGFVLPQVRVKDDLALDANTCVRSSAKKWFEFRSLMNCEQKRWLNFFVLI